MVARSGYDPSVTVRASATFETSAGTTTSNDVHSYGGALGLILYIRQSVVAESSVGGGTGAMVHTIQFKDPISSEYANSTGVVTATTDVGTFVLQCYPGMAAVAASTVGVGKADMTVPNVWRVSSASSSSATNRTYSIAAQFLPTAASSS